MHFPTEFPSEQQARLQQAPGSWTTHSPPSGTQVGGGVTHVVFVRVQVTVFVQWRLWPWPQLFSSYFRWSGQLSLEFLRVGVGLQVEEVTVEVVVVVVVIVLHLLCLQWLCLSW